MKYSFKPEFYFNYAPLCKSKELLITKYNYFQYEVLSVLKNAIFV